MPLDVTAESGKPMFVGAYRNPSADAVNRRVELFLLKATVLRAGSK